MDSKEGRTISPRMQHSTLLRRLASMRRDADRLCEESIALDWEPAAIFFVHRLWAQLDEMYYQAQRLEDQGQLPL